MGVAKNKNPRAKSKKIDPNLKLDLSNTPKRSTRKIKAFNLTDEALNDEHTCSGCRGMDSLNGCSRKSSGKPLEVSSNGKCLNKW